MTTYAQQANSGKDTSSSSDFSKKEEFRRYLDKTGVLDALTKVLVGLYEEPERPQSAIDYIKRYIGAPPNVDVEGLQRENERLKAELEALRNSNNNNNNNSANAHAHAQASVNTSSNNVNANTNKTSASSSTTTAGTVAFSSSNSQQPKGGKLNNSNGSNITTSASS